ncbi:hypothetical protein TcasGA2_TC009726 [Tribolium castaneum]|uniref:Uncharacterized protein n=1 Tax=Tribolium castaneum TaxID=7070 RepID=D6WUA0_TRICA|nr:hypothetical protein TcasGA2_TC009726 [Tribolium castaneum]
MTLLPNRRNTPVNLYFEDRSQECDFNTALNIRISCNQGIRKNQSYLLREVSTINFFWRDEGALNTALSFKRVELQIQSRKTLGMGYRDCISNTSLFVTRPVQMLTAAEKGRAEKLNGQLVEIAL